MRCPTHSGTAGALAAATGAFADDLLQYARALRRVTGRAGVRAFALITHQVRTGAEALGLEQLHAASVDAVRDVRRTRDLASSRPVIEALARACERAAAARCADAA